MADPVRRAAAAADLRLDRVTRAWAATLIVAVCACGGGDSPDPPDAPSDRERIVDDAGRVYTGPVPPARVVSLVPSASAVIVALGRGDAIVGRTDFDTASVLRDVASVGGGLEPDLERLLVLDPDVVIRFEGPSDPATPERLDAFGIAHIGVRPDRIDDVRRTVALLGRVMASEAAADSIVASIEADLAALQERVANLPRPRVAYVVGGSPPWVAGGSSFIGELVTLAGGINVFEDLGRPFLSVSVEAFLTRDIDVVLHPRGAEIEPSLLGGEVRAVDPAVEIPGPGLGASAWAVARALHGDRIR